MQFRITQNGTSLGEGKRLNEFRITKSFIYKDVIGSRREVSTSHRQRKEIIMMTTPMIITWMAALTAATTFIMESGFRK